GICFGKTNSLRNACNNYRYPDKRRSVNLKRLGLTTVSCVAILLMGLDSAFSQSVFDGEFDEKYYGAGDTRSQQGSYAISGTGLVVGHRYPDAVIWAPSFGNPA